MTTWWIRRSRSMPIIHTNTRVVHVCQEPFYSIKKDCCDKLDTLKSGFMCALQHLTIWMPEDAPTLFDHCKDIKFFTMEYECVDFSIDLAPWIAHLTENNVNCERYSRGRHCHALDYIVNQFFYDYSVEECRHLLAYAYVLLSRIVKYQQNRIPIATLNAIVCSSILISNKILDDTYLCNEYWAGRLRVGLGGFNRLEVEFLKLCQFDLFVSASTLEDAETFLYTDVH